MSKKISTEYSNNPTRGDDTTRDIIIPAEDADTGEDVALKTSQLAEFIDDDLGIRSETNGLTADINDLRDDVDYLLNAVDQPDTPVAGSANFTVTPGANNLNALVGVNVGSMNAARIWIQQGTRTAPTTTSQGTEASWTGLRYFFSSFPDWTSETFTVDVYDSDALTWVQATDGAGSTSIIATPVYNLDPPVPTSITATPGAAGSGEVVVSWSETEPPPGLDQTNIFIRNASDDTLVGSYYDQTPSATLGNLPMGIDLYAEVELQSNPTPAIQYSRANSASFNIDLDDAGDFDGLIWIDVSPSATRRFSEDSPGGEATFDVHVSGSQSDANVTVKVSTRDTPAASGGVLSFDTTDDIDAVNDEIDITHGLSTGDVISYRKNAQNQTGNTSAVGLTDGDQLWVRRVSSGSFSLHTSLAGAQADTGQVVLNTDTAETHYLIYNDFEEFSDVDVDITVSGGTGSATVTVALVDTDNIYNRAFDVYLPPTQDMDLVSANKTAVIVGRYDEVAQGRSNAMQLVTLGSATGSTVPQVDDVTAGANTVKGVVFDFSDWDRQEDNGASIPWTTAQGAGTFPDTPTDLSDAEGHSSASAIIVGGGDYGDAATYYDSAPRIEHDFDTNGNLGTYEAWMLTFAAASGNHRFWPTLDGTEQFNNAGSPTTAAYAASPSDLWEWRKVGKSLSTDLSCTIGVDGVHTFGASVAREYFVCNKAILFLNDGSAAALNFDPNDEGSADPSGSHAATGPAVTTKTAGVEVVEHSGNPADAFDPGAVSTVDYDPIAFIPEHNEQQVSVTPLLRIFWDVGANSITVENAKVVDSNGNETLCTTEVHSPNILRLIPNSQLPYNTDHDVVANGFIRKPDNVLSPWSIVQ